MSNMRQKPGKLLQEATFKRVGKDETKTCKIGKAVKVDRHALDMGNYVIWADKLHYLIVGGEVLNTYVEFKD